MKILLILGLFITACLWLIPHNEPSKEELHRQHWPETLAESEKYQHATPPPSKEEQLPAVEWAREMLREKIAEHGGVPVDRYTPMPCIYIQWDTTNFPRIDGERCWFAVFQYEGGTAFLKGHGTTVIQWMGAGSVGPLEVPAKVRQQLEAQREAQMKANHQYEVENERRAQASIKAWELAQEKWRAEQAAKQKAETDKMQAEADAIRKADAKEQLEREARGRRESAKNSAKWNSHFDNR
jgi:hypothetical protein